VESYGYVRPFRFICFGIASIRVRFIFLRRLLGEGSGEGELKVLH
jgi:hypothetical protein